jgi:hypothetical protein
MTDHTEKLNALIRAAASFAYDVGHQIRDENSDNAKALALVLASDPGAEFIVSVRVAPDVRVVLSVVVGGKQYLISEHAAREVGAVLQ